MPPPPYRSLWLTLGEVRAELIARRFTAAEASLEIERAIRDAELPVADGQGLHIRLNSNDNQYFSSSWGAWGWDWLRVDPKLDWDASNIRVPMTAPTRSITEETLRMLNGQRNQAAWYWIRVEILRVDLDRLWPIETNGLIPRDSILPIDSSDSPPSGAAVNGQIAKTGDLTAMIADDPLLPSPTPEAVKRVMTDVVRSFGLPTTSEVIEALQGKFCRAVPRRLVRQAMHELGIMLPRGHRASSPPNRQA